MHTSLVISKCSTLPFVFPSASEAAGEAGSHLLLSYLHSRLRGKFKFGITSDSWTQLKCSCTFISVHRIPKTSYLPWHLLLFFRTHERETNENVFLVCITAEWITWTVILLPAWPESPSICRWLICRVYRGAEGGGVGESWGGAAYVSPQEPGVKACPSRATA